jgi:hypothetical protein
MTKLNQGDIFEINSNGKRYYFQYVVNDKNNLNGNVIRCFNYFSDEKTPVDINTLRNLHTFFFMQTYIAWGIKLKLWKKIGNIPLPPDFIMPFFKHTGDVYSEVKKSNKWYVWQPNGVKQYVGELKNEYKLFPYAAVMHPIALVKIIEAGHDYYLIPD